MNMVLYHDMNSAKGHNREDMQADDYLTMPCIFIMGSSTLSGRLLATFSTLHNALITNQSVHKVEHSVSTVGNRPE